MFRKTGPGLVLAVAVLMLPGCFFDPDIDEVVVALEQELAPAELHTQTTLKVGPGLLALARGLSGFVSDPDVRDARAILSGVNEIHVGVYDVDGADFDHRDFRMPAQMRERLENHGWQVIVQATERESSVWVMAQPTSSRLDGLYVIVLEDEELMVVKLRGNLSRTIEAAVRTAMRHESGDFSRSIRDAAGA